MARQTIGHMAAKPSSAPRQNSVGLEADQLVALLTTLDSTQKAGNASRIHTRVPFRHPALLLTLTRPDGSHATLRVAGRNLSCGGAAVLHNAYVHVGTRGVVQLPVVKGSPRSLDVTIVRCLHRAGTIHELGLKFDTPIVMHDFLPPGPIIARYSYERVEPSSLSGSVLLVSPSNSFRGLVHAYIHGAPIKLHDAPSCEACMALPLDTFDLVVIDAKLADASLASLASNLRAMGCDAPLVVAATPESFADLAAHAPVSALVHSPVRREELLSALAEFLLAPDASTGDPLAESAREIDGAIQADDLLGCVAACAALAAKARQQGDAFNARAADTVIETLKAQRAIVPARPALDELVTRLAGPHPSTKKGD